MTEWNVIEVITVITGLFVTIGLPVIRLNGTISKLNITVDNLDKRFEKFEGDNHDSHKRLWNKNEEQDKKIGDHETRIKILEK